MSRTNGGTGNTSATSTPPHFYIIMFDILPVDLIAEILGELDLESLIKMAYISKRFNLIASDSSLNPWRRPIMRTLRTDTYEKALKHLSIRMIVPRQNWIEILSLARPSYILYEATLPNLREVDWEESFKRRFLPSWAKWRKDSSWKEVFLKVLHRVWHRSVSSCTTDESWTKYIVLNRNGSANELEMSSRNFNPITIFNEIKLQSNLLQFETRVTLVVEFTDVRILAFGTLAKPRSNFNVNPNAHKFLNPPGIVPSTSENTFLLPTREKPSNLIDDHGVYPVSPTTTSAFFFNEYRNPSIIYSRLTHPEPTTGYYNYPFYTTGGGDLRWLDMEEIEERGCRWLGPVMITAQLITPATDTVNIMQTRQQYSSLSWVDLWVIAPWMEEIISKKIDGPGLGN